MRRASAPHSRNEPDSRGVANEISKIVDTYIRYSVSSHPLSFSEAINCEADFMKCPACRARLRPTCRTEAVGTRWSVRTVLTP